MYRNYNFKRFDLVAGIKLRLEWGDTASLIGIVDSCDDKTVTLSVVWSKCQEGPYENQFPAWFLGDTIEFESEKSFCYNSTQFYNNIVPIGDLSFPYDLPGHYPAGGVFDDRLFEEAKRRGKIADREQFKDLLAYVRLNDEKGIGSAICDFFKKEGWSDYANTFIQGVHKDGRELKTHKGQVPALIFI